MPASSFALQEEAVRNQNYELAGDLKTEDNLRYRGTRALGYMGVIKVPKEPELKDLNLT